MRLQSSKIIHSLVRQHESSFKVCTNVHNIYAHGGEDAGTGGGGGGVGA